MDAPDSALLDDTSSTNTTNAQETAPTAFTAQWQSPDTARLLPANLPIARVQRAWERKALSPLNQSRRRGVNGAGKLWKRFSRVGAVQHALPSLRGVEMVEVGGEAGVQRSEAHALQSPLTVRKPVKKLCLDSAYGIGPRVSRWEVRGGGSPVRKIVTRSAGAVGGLVALAEDDGSVEVVGAEGEGAAEAVTIEIEVLDGEGNVVGGAEGVEEVGDGWSDVEEEEETAEEDADVPFDDTMMHLSEAVQHAEGPQQLTPTETTTSTAVQAEQQQTLSTPPEHSPSNNEPSTAPQTQTSSSSTPAHETEALPSVVKQTQPVILPEGFVSPIKQRRKLGPRSSRVVAAARRQTLPTQFAPSLAAGAAPPATAEDGAIEGALVVEPAVAEGEGAEGVGGAAVVMAEVPGEEAIGSLMGDERTEEVLARDADAADGEWEDIPAEEEDATDTPAEPLTRHSPEKLALTRLFPNTQSSAEEADERIMKIDGQSWPLLASQTSSHDIILSSKLAERSPASPAPLALDSSPSPRLPLRRSPRRLSCSPAKQKVVSATAQSHPTVAFTPLGRSPGGNSIPSFAGEHVSTDQQAAAAASASAANNPEPAQASPISHASAANPSDMIMADASQSAAPDDMTSHRGKPPAMKPARVSDDTALLQAFLNRAAASRSKSAMPSPPRGEDGEKGKGVRGSSSASEQEAVENRRDSDVVKAALATPYPQGAAGEGPLVGEAPRDLDPNGDNAKSSTKGIVGSAEHDVAYDSDALNNIFTSADEEALAMPSSGWPGTSNTDLTSAAIGEDEQILYSPPGPPSSPQQTTQRRSSGRSRKQPAVLLSSQDGPARITIRGPSTTNILSTVRKPTEAQALAKCTRDNTRRNKGGSLMPNLRFLKMAAGEKGEGDGGGAGQDPGASIDGEANDDGEGRAVAIPPPTTVPGRRGIAWAEQLVEFYQGPTETSLEAGQWQSEEPEERMPWERPAGAEDEEPDEIVEAVHGEVVVAPPAPADTPSKPKPKAKAKMRRLKAPARTAGAVAAAQREGASQVIHQPAETKASPLSPPASEPTATAPVQAQPRAQAVQPKPAHSSNKPRRSRIATPAKSLLNPNPSLPLASTTSAPTIPASAAPLPAEIKTAAPAKRKPAPSKLPTAPAPSSLGAGKENQSTLLLSPAKKKGNGRTAAAATTLPTSAFTFAPKLDLGGKGAKLELSRPGEGGAEAKGVPGLASPAKKAGGRKVGGLFGSGLTGLTGGDGGGGGGFGAEEVPLGLRSPAKKRARRGGGL